MNLRQNDSLRPHYSLRTLHAPAKINLYLDVQERGTDGYHALSTLMVPIRWFDSLSFEPVAATGGRPGPIEFSQHLSSQRGGDAVPADASNLVVRAVELLRERSGCDQGACMELVKRIPSGAGLGGGSSDAAAALRLANRGWGIDWPAERLASLAADLGSDVPFFLERGAAICRGRGERVERLPALAPLELVIVKPPVSLSTASVYRKFDATCGAERAEGQSARALASLVLALRRGVVCGVARWMSNGLQTAAAGLSSWVERVSSAFAELDFAAHQLSGSGSAYFGICRHAGQARRLAAILKTRRLGLVCVTRSCS